MGVRIPGGHDLTADDLVAFLRGDLRAVRNLVALALAAELVDHADLAGTRDRHQVALLVLHGLHVVEAQRALVAHFERRSRSGSRRGTTDVERAHRELRARLADRLRGHDADRFADVDLAASREVASVAGGADAVARLAGDGRANLHDVDAFLLDEAHHLFVDERARRQQHLFGARLEDVFDHGAAEDAFAERFHHVTAFDQRHHRETQRRAAIRLRDHEILRDVDETAREVTRVRRLQRRVGQTLAGAVRRDEVLLGVEAFAEVRRDGRLDDRAVRLGHEAAHAGELADLRRATAGAGVGHHEDRVERLLLLRLAVGVDGVFDAELLHHGLGDLVVRARPDVDDLVVALAVRDETGRVLVLDLLHVLVGGRDDLGLLFRDHDVVDAERDRRTRGVLEARVHELVGEDDRLLETQRAVTRVDRRGDDLLGHVLVHEIEGQALRQDLGRAASGRPWCSPRAASR